MRMLITKLKQREGRLSQRNKQEEIYRGSFRYRNIKERKLMMIYQQYVNNRELIVKEEFTMKIQLSISKNQYSNKLKLEREKEH